MMPLPRWSSFLLTSALLGLAGCVTSQISQGELSAGVYHSASGDFSMAVPAEAIIHDGLFPLGGYVDLSNLAEPVIRQGIVYNRVALPAEGISTDDQRNLVRGALESWMVFFTDLTEDDILYQEWLELDGRPVHFSVLEGPDGGALVKPASYYASYSVLIGNYSYTLFERVSAPYQLKGTEDSAERLARLDPETRKASILKFTEGFRFHQTEERLFPLAE